MGLFLGASILTVSEIFEFIFGYLGQVLCKSKRGQARNNSRVTVTAGHSTNNEEKF